MSEEASLTHELEPQKVPIVGLDQEFNPFNRQTGDKVVLHSGAFPDLQFQGSHTYNINFKALKGYDLDQLEEIIGLSMSVAAPEGEFEARLNPRHLPQGALSFYDFARINPEGTVEIWNDTPSIPVPNIPTPQEERIIEEIRQKINDPQYLVSLRFAFHLREENKGKLPKNPRFPKADPEGNLASYIAYEYKGKKARAEKFKKRVLSDPSLLDFFLNGPKGLTY